MSNPDSITGSVDDLTAEEIAALLEGSEPETEPEAEPEIEPKAEPEDGDEGGIDLRKARVFQNSTGGLTILAPFAERGDLWGQFDVFLIGSRTVPTEKVMELFAKIGAEGDTAEGDTAEGDTAEVSDPVKSDATVDTDGTVD